MTDLFDISPNAEPPAEPETHDATVIEDAVPGRRVKVRIPALSNELVGAECAWSPIANEIGLFYPHAGDRAVVIQPVPGGEAWAIWEHTRTTPDMPITGERGPQGLPGATGRAAGLRYVYSTNTANSAPATGGVKFDSTSLTAATVMRISKTDSDGAAISAILDGWDDSTSAVRGLVTVRRVSNPSVYRTWSITANRTDNGTWDSFAINQVAGNGTSWTNGEGVYLTFDRTGDKGDTGATGPTGATGADGMNGTDLAIGTYKTIMSAGAMAYSLAGFNTSRYGLSQPSQIPHLPGQATTPTVIYLDPTDYAVSGKTTRLRMRGQVLTNATSPAHTLTLGLSSITASAGASNVISPTFGTPVSGSTVSLVLGASGRYQGNSGDFAVPAAGWYAVTAVASAAQAANSFSAVTAQLQVHHI